MPQNAPSYANTRAAVQPRTDLLKFGLPVSAVNTSIPLVVHLYTRTDRTQAEVQTVPREAVRRAGTPALPAKAAPW